ncbi:MAG: hypothetical protein HZC02_02205 [Candidatus Levybacteria bacterium]|nr:hypothetical protein [Candidatus Levybacteria bacterium]
MKMFIDFLKKNFYTLLLLAVLSSIFRIFFMENIQFASDQSLSFYTVYSFVVNHQFPSIGMMSSAGFYNFPLFLYFMSFLSFIYTEIKFLTFEIAMLNVFAVLGFYYFARKFYSQFVAVSSSLLLALAPWPILFSRVIWQQDVIIVFLLPFLYFFHRLIYLKDKKSTLATFFFGVLLMQIHTSCIFFIAISIVYAYSQKVKFKKLYAILGTVLGLIPAIPYLRYQFFSGIFCADCSRLAQSRSNTFTLDMFNFLRPLELFTTFNFDFQLGKSYQEFVSSSFLIIPIQIITLFSSVLVLMGIYFVSRKNKKYSLLAAYSVFLPILYFFAGNVAYMHYFAVIVPVVALLAGLGFEYLVKITKRSVVRKFFYVLFSLVLLSFFLFEVLFNSFLSTKKQVLGDYARIWEVGENIITRRLQPYEGEPYYTDLKYFSSVYIYSSLFHLIVGDYLMAKNNVEGAINEYSQYLNGTSDLQGTPGDTQIRERLDNLKKQLHK